MQNTYLEMLNLLESKYSQYVEVDNRIEEIEKIPLKIGDIVICVNDNFFRFDPTHGKKDGLSLNSTYEILAIKDLDMVFIKDDNGNVYPYFNWVFELKN